MKVIEQPLNVKRKRFNRNKKKAWRKKIYLRDIEKAEDEKNREERHGGILEDKPSNSLFSLDFGSHDQSESKTSKEDNVDRPSSLKCHWLIDGLPGVKAISIKGPTLQQKEPQKLSSARKANKFPAIQKRVENQRKTSLQKHNRERRIIRKDLWAPKDRDLDRLNEVTRSFMEDPVTFSRRQTRKLPVRTPGHLLKKPSSVPAVEVPDPGTSYNPSFEDHQKLLKSAVLKEEKRLKRQKKKTKFEEKVNSAISGGVTEAERLAELTEGLPFLDTKSTPDKAESSRNESDIASFKVSLVEKKHPKEKRTKREKRIQEHREAEKKKKDLLENEIYRLKSIKKDIAQQEVEFAEKKKKEKKKKHIAKYQTKRLSKHKFRPQAAPVPLGTDLSGSLRTMKPLRASLRSAFKHMQRRNMVEPRGLPPKLNRKTKLIERRSVKNDKMAFLDSFK